MKTQYQVNSLIELVFSLKMQEQAFAQEVRKLFLVKLYEMDKISAGKAGKIIGITRLDFFGIVETIPSQSF